MGAQMRTGWIGVGLAGLAFALSSASAQASKVVPQTVGYGPAPAQFAELYAGGPATVLLLHENGETWKAVSPYAEQLRLAGFTVVDLEWEKVKEKVGSEVWGPLTSQIETAIGYVRSHAAALGVDPARLAMVGGSRGANLSMLTALNVDLAEPGTIKAVVSLSGDANPRAQIERTTHELENGEPVDKKALNKITKTYGCEKKLTNCPLGYVAEWSPFQKVTETPAGESAPAMLVMASKEEQTTANSADQQALAEALQADGVTAEAVIPQSGHGFVYWGQVREHAIEFLRANTGGE
jgi:dienelactone hydrolase